MSTRSRVRASALYVSGLLLLGPAAGCSLLLGIEDAHVDPLLAGRDNTPGSDAGRSDAGAGGAGGASTDSSAPPDEASTSDDASHPESGADSAGGASAICQQYCSDILSYCNGNLRQYIDNLQCLKVCSLFPEGTIGGDDGNSAACRLKYAGKARYANGSELDAYCRKAGPGSDGTCGTICDGYCTLMMPTCTEARTAPYFFASTGDCMSLCAGLRDNPPYSVADGTLPDRNDAQCRLFHTTSAVMDPDEHCEHAMGVTFCDSKLEGGAD